MSIDMLEIIVVIGFMILATIKAVHSVLNQNQNFDTALWAAFSLIWAFNVFLRIL